LELFLGGSAAQTFELLRHYGLFAYLFPDTEACLAVEEGGYPHVLLVQALKNTDERIAENKPVTPAFLFAALLWEPMRVLANEYQQNGMTEIQSAQLAGQNVLVKQNTRVVLPKRFSSQSREIWVMQLRLKRTTGVRAFRLLEHARFRAAYDFMLLRAEAGEDLQSLCEWWTKFQVVSEEEKKVMSRSPNYKKDGPRKRKKRKRKVGTKPE